MKKLFALASIILILASCGSSKKAVAPASAPEGKSLGLKVQKSPEQLYAEDPEAENMRAWGFRNGFESQNLEALAATEARAKLAEEVATLVKSAIDIYEKNAKIDNKSLNAKAENVKTTESQDIVKVSAVAKELIRGSRIVMSDRYLQEDGTVNCYSAVEVNMKGILDNIKKNASIQEAISESRQARIDFNSKMFEESMKSAFDELKAAKAE